MIRQLYYPYRLWKSKINKEVRCLFLTYTNGIFHFREYSFEDFRHYNSLKLLRQKKYAILETQDELINFELITKLQQEITIVQEPKIPFPQADSFARIINLCELLNQHKFLTKEYITENYYFSEKHFDDRQTNYYADAARYLGLVDKKKENNKVGYFLTNTGNNLFKLSISDRQLFLAKLILSHSVFNKALKLYFEKLDSPNKSEIVDLMKQSNLYEVHSESTFERRASTVLSWTKWILDLIEE